MAHLLFPIFVPKAATITSGRALIASLLPSAVAAIVYYIIHSDDEAIFFDLQKVGGLFPKEQINSDITDVKRLQKQLERHAYYDELTQLMNRRAFLE